MPIIVKDFTWKQSDDTVSISVPSKGIHYNHIDILLNENYVKLHYPPFIFEIFLRHPIKENDSKCYFTEKESILELIKCENIIWDKLEANIDKKEKVEIKLNIIENIQVKTRKQLDEQIQLKADLGKFAVSEAMEMDAKRICKIENLRNAERKFAMDDLEEWRNSKENYRSNVKQDSMKESVTITEITEDTDKKKAERVNHLYKSLGKSLCVQDRKSDVKIAAINDNNFEVNKPNKIIPKKSNFYNKVVSDIENRVIPCIRRTSTLNISFTERIFPTPSRESSAHDEEIWLKNVNEARRATGFISEDLRPEEQDPQWCKDKGDEFLKAENYLGAISAYSHGIKLSEKLPALYSNRAAAQFVIGNFNKCIEDCSKALDLLKPPCPLNLNSRVRCIARRAAALTRVGMLNKGINEMKIAIKLQPNNQQLKDDLYHMERAWEQDPDSD